MIHLSQGKHIAAFPGFVDTFNKLVDFVDNFSVSGEGLTLEHKDTNPCIRLDLSSVGQTMTVVTGIDISKTDTKSEITITTQDVRVLSVGDSSSDAQTVFEIPKMAEMETVDYTLENKRVIAEVAASSNNLEMKIKSVTLVTPKDEDVPPDATKTLQSGSDSNIKFTQSGSDETATISADVYYK